MGLKLRLGVAARPPPPANTLAAIPNGGLWSRLRGSGDGAGAPGPRPLKQLIKQVEKATQVRRSGLGQVLTELQAHRDATSDGELRSALAWLCNAVTRFQSEPTAPRTREVALAAYEVNRLLAAG